MIYIMCHGGTEAVIARHLPLWLKSGDTLAFVSPTDNPLKETFGKLHYNVGLNGKLCPGIGQRFQWILSDIAKHQDDYCVIYEYDSFCLKFDEDRPVGLNGIANCGGIVDHVAQRYALAPWVIDRASAQLINEAAYRWFNLGDDWCADRLISGWAQLASVPIISYGKAGYAQNDIDLSHCIDIAARKQFPLWYHGVKTEDVFTTIMGLAKDRGIL